MFDTLGSTFIPKIFANRDQASLFGGFEDPIEELVKEFYSNSQFTKAELECWVRGKDFFIISDYLAKILQMNRLVNVDASLMMIDQLWLSKFLKHQEQIMKFPPLVHQLALQDLGQK